MMKESTDPRTTRRRLTMQLAGIIYRKKLKYAKNVRQDMDRFEAILTHGWDGFFADLKSAELDVNELRKQIRALGTKPCI
jgi:hypothetical protein